MRAADALRAETHRDGLEALHAGRVVMAVNRDTPVFDILTMSGRIRDQTWFYWVFSAGE